MLRVGSTIRESASRCPDVTTNSAATAGSTNWADAVHGLSVKLVFWEVVLTGSTISAFAVTTSAAKSKLLIVVVDGILLLPNHRILINGQRSIVSLPTIGEDGQNEAYFRDTLKVSSYSIENDFGTSFEYLTPI